MRAGLVQLRLPTGHTSEEYVSHQGWRDASLQRCPRHPEGGCGFRRHGTYVRKSPYGAQVARWYCHKAHQTFSLLPDCLSARWPGTLAEVEQAVMTVEQSASVQGAADRLRPDIELPGAIRWTRRRVRAVYEVLTTLRGLFPERFESVSISLGAFAGAVGEQPVLPALRAMAGAYIQHLPTPLGFHHRTGGGGERTEPMQQSMGPDPPPGDG